MGIDASEADRYYEICMQSSDEIMKSGLYGLPVRLMSVLFNIVTGIAIALTIPAAGALLVSTIMVLPASIAMRLGKNFKSVILIGVIVGFIGMVAGIITSYYWETPASATITVIFVGIFLLVNLFNMILHRNS